MARSARVGGARERAAAVGRHRHQREMGDADLAPENAMVCARVSRLAVVGPAETYCRG